MLAVGCRPADEIRTYRIAKPEAETPSAGPTATAPTTPPAVAPRPQGEPTDRLLGSILRSPSQAWFFKAVGPRAAIDSSADVITAFLNSVRIEGDQPEWTTPDGWTEKRGGGMRLATLTIPTPDSPGETELSVIGLGLADDWDTQVLDNLNRWRKQLNQPPVQAVALAEAVEPLSEAGEGAVLIDQVGWFDGGSMPPFAGATPKASPVVPPVAPPHGGSEDLNGEKPEAWADGPASTMRKASFEAPGGAAVTAFAFNAAGAMGDRVANVNRWRGEIGLPATDAEKLAAETEAMPLLGGDGAYFELVGEEETTYAAMVVRDGQVWFFKIRGASEAVEAQREAFRGWLKSLSL